MGVNRLGLVGARPFVKRQEIIHAKRDGIGDGVEEGIGGLDHAHEAAGFFADAKMFEIGGGAMEIQRNIIAKEMGL